VHLNGMDWLAFVLVIVGGLNWGLVGLFNFNLVTFIFGSVPILERLIYILVGIAAIYLAYFTSKVERDEPRTMRPRTSA
jgi:uncharacterized protein